MGLNAKRLRISKIALATAWGDEQLDNWMRTIMNRPAHAWNRSWEVHDSRWCA